MTFGRYEDVEWMTTSTGFASRPAVSVAMVTPQRPSVEPTTSPRSRPAFAGSLSIAPTISIDAFCRISRAIDAPIGPTPYCTTRIFFFKVGSPVSKGTNTLKFLRGGVQEVWRNLRPTDTKRHLRTLGSYRLQCRHS